MFDFSKRYTQMTKLDITTENRAKKRNLRRKQHLRTDITRKVKGKQTFEEVVTLR
jgi:hypothetical protein